jgi:hypothetical protein
MASMAKNGGRRTRRVFTEEFRAGAGRAGRQRYCTFSMPQLDLRTGVAPEA